MRNTEWREEHRPLRFVWFKSVNETSRKRAMNASRWNNEDGSNEGDTRSSSSSRSSLPRHRQIVSMNSISSNLWRFVTCFSLAYVPRGFFFGLVHRKMPTRTHLDAHLTENCQLKKRTTKPNKTTTLVRFLSTLSTVNHYVVQTHYRVVCSINSEIFMMIIILCTNAFENNRQFMWISTAMEMWILKRSPASRTRSHTHFILIPSSSSM